MDNVFCIIDLYKLRKTVDICMYVYMAYVSTYIHVHMYKILKANKYIYIYVYVYNNSIYTHVDS